MIFKTSIDLESSPRQQAAGLLIVAWLPVFTVIYAAYSSVAGSR